ncbi:MAG: dihydroneopterin aldolase [Tissierellia bacterium]|nr:dihydroneopterin aldolase [Tissierellia bacterium]
MDKLIIKDMRLYGYHGVFEQEKQEGQPFLLQAELWIDKRNTTEENLETTVNYAACYEEIKEVFARPYMLLENLSLAMIEALFAYDERIKEVCITVEKLRPPVAGDLGSLGVVLCRQRKSISL